MEAAIEGEVDAHLDYEERKDGNCKNCKTSKTLQTSEGPIEIETSHDRNATFEPELAKIQERVKV